MMTGTLFPRGRSRATKHGGGTVDPPQRAVGGQGGVAGPYIYIPGADHSTLRMGKADLHQRVHRTWGVIRTIFFFFFSVKRP